MRYDIKIVLLVLCSVATSNQLMAQSNANHYMRVARIVVDSAQLESYKEALKAGISTAVKVEPGVLSLFAVFEKDHPTHVTVFEVYANEKAYKTHIQTAHFLKYKNTVQHMVRSLELVDVSPIALESKQ
jgi:quinol monooxygenase YgiN